MTVRFNHPPLDAPPAVQWWTDFYTVSGVTCEGAYQGKGAPTQAASYTDLSGNNRNLTAGVAPGWASNTGWQFNGSTHYLNTGVVPPGSGQGWSMIARYTDHTLASWTSLAGYIDSVSGRQFYMGGKRSGANSFPFAQGAWLNANSAGSTAHVIAIAGSDAFIDAVDVGNIGAGAAGTAYQFTLAARNNDDSSYDLFFNGYLVAISFYSGILSPANITDIGTKMNAL